MGTLHSSKEGIQAALTPGKTIQDNEQLPSQPSPLTIILVNLSDLNLLF